MSIIEYLKAPKGAKKKSKRRGRGAASGHGKTSCRGHKGQQARGNTKRGKGYEGGQMSLIRRLPKRGFNSKNRIEVQLINLTHLDSLKGIEKITPDTLIEKGIIKKSSLPVKLLANGKITSKVDISVHAASKKAIEAVEKAGGKVVLI
ncbi:MAG: 50S ribosomal protein L15 [Candidatus Omnitrophota bacterium]